ncbi:MAG: hypothetical protein RR225_05295 [Clostridium sp.]
MSSVLVNIPDDGWILANSIIEPDDKMLCVVVCKYSNNPEICQYRKADWLYKDSDYFLRVGERWRLKEMGIEDAWEPSFTPFEIISSWKPLGLQPEHNKAVLENIELWFDD